MMGLTVSAILKPTCGVLLLFLIISMFNFMRRIRLVFLIQKFIVKHVLGKSADRTLRTEEAVKITRDKTPKSNNKKVVLRKNVQGKPAVNFDIKEKLDALSQRLNGLILNKKQKMSYELVKARVPKITIDEKFTTLLEKTQRRTEINDHGLSVKQKKEASARREEEFVILIDYCCNKYMHPRNGSSNLWQDISANKLGIFHEFERLKETCSEFLNPTPREII